jgi:hypothetical protein
MLISIEGHSQLSFNAIAEKIRIKYALYVRKISWFIVVINECTSMKTNILKHIKIIIYAVYVCKNDKATHFYHRKLFNKTHSGLDINVCPIPVKTDVVQVDLVSRLSDGTSEKMTVLPFECYFL